jgi:hypothetical protein
MENTSAECCDAEQRQVGLALGSTKQVAIIA